MIDTACGLCGQPVRAERGPIVMDARRMPMAASIRPGFGVPLIDVSSTSFAVFCDGEEVPACLGFDRERGLAWKYQRVGDGGYAARDGELLAVQVEGVITVEPRS